MSTTFSGLSTVKAIVWLLLGSVMPQLCNAQASNSSISDFINEIQSTSITVALPGSGPYNTSESTYFSYPQGELDPSAVVLPQSAEDVSAILLLAKKYEVPFAVKSGGHMTWKGSSNIGAEGFTMDLSGLLTLELQTDNTVRLGPGLRWNAVYNFLAEKGRITLGARVLDVGVGGFLLGSGIGLITPQRGFASANVLSYTVVLASGEIVTASNTSNPDLYWSLKFGSTNFGIVTEFTLNTFEQSSDVFGGAQVFSAADDTDVTVLEAFHEFVDTIEENDNRLFSPVVTWDAASSSYIVWNPFLQWGNLPENQSDWAAANLSPLAGKNLNTTIADTTRVTTVLDILEEFGDSPVLSPSRNVWYTVTLRQDVSFMHEVFLQAQDIFKDLLPNSNDTDEQKASKDPDATWAYLIQPLPRSFQTKSGDHPLKMVDVDGGEDLWLLALFIVWQDAAFDDVMSQAGADFYTWTRDTAESRGLLTNFVYSNYAKGDQDPGVFESLTDQDRMLQTRDTYDPEGIFAEGGLWKGGFKLPQ